VLAASNAGQSYVDWFIEGKPVAGAAAGAPNAAAQRPARQAPPEPTGPVDVPVAKEDPQVGPETAPVTVVVFSDFQ
jgi:protein-disulfide isomerase